MPTPRVTAVLLAVTLLLSLMAVPAAAGPDVPGLPGPGEQMRLDGGDPTTVALQASGLRWGDGEAELVALARDDLFADALAGSVLTLHGPLLFSGVDGVGPDTLAEVRRVLAPGAPVLMLGGEAALPAAVEAQLREEGFDPVRLSGPSRIETAVAVATYLFDNLFLGTELPEAYLVRAGAPADNPTAAWADSIAIGPRAAAFESPVLLTPSDGPLHPAVRDFLEAHPPGDLLLVGGEAALSASVLASAEETIGRFPGRIAGSTRLDTARRTGWLLTDEAARVVVDVFDPDGWAYGLAAATFTMPLLGVNGDDVPLETRTAFDPCAVGLVLVGGTDTLSAQVEPDTACDPADDAWTSSWCEELTDERVSGLLDRTVGEVGGSGLGYHDLCSWGTLDGPYSELLLDTNPNEAGAEELGFLRQSCEGFEEVREVTLAGRDAVLCRFGEVGGQGFTTAAVAHDNPYVWTRVDLTLDEGPAPLDLLEEVITEVFTQRYAPGDLLG